MSLVLSRLLYVYIHILYCIVLYCMYATSISVTVRLNTISIRIYAIKERKRIWDDDDHHHRQYADDDGKHTTHHPMCCVQYMSCWFKFEFECVDIRLVRTNVYYLFRQFIFNKKMCFIWLLFTIVLKDFKLVIALPFKKKSVWVLAKCTNSSNSPTKDLYHKIWIEYDFSKVWLRMCASMGKQHIHHSTLV